MFTDENVLVLTYTGAFTVTETVKPLIGEYARTEPGCFRKSTGGKIHFTAGYWYIVDKLGQQVAWVEGMPSKAPQTGWKTGGSMFSSSEILKISVDPKVVEPPPQPEGEEEVQQPEDLGPGCFTQLYDKWDAYKAGLPEEKKAQIEVYEGKLNDNYKKFHQKLGEHTSKAKEVHETYYPIVREHSKKGFDNCYAFWTHEDTQEAIKTGVTKAIGCIKFTLAGCLTLTAACIDMAVGGHKKDASATPRGERKSDAPTTSGTLVNEQAMDASYVKLEEPLLQEPLLQEPKAPVVVHPTNLIAEPVTTPLHTS